LWINFLVFEQLDVIETNIVEWIVHKYWSWVVKTKRLPIIVIPDIYTGKYFFRLRERDEFFFFLLNNDGER
jgi:hypothetical protein